MSKENKFHKLIVSLADSAEKNHQLLNELKHISVQHQKYELAAHIRDIEKTNFPESEENKKIKAELKLFMIALGSAKLTVRDDSSALTLLMMTKKFIEKEGELLPVDIAKILEDVNNILI